MLDAHDSARASRADRRSAVRSSVHDGRPCRLSGGLSRFVNAAAFALRFFVGFVIVWA
jgi:hypothetical protein